MILGGVRERNQHRRPAAGGQFRHRGGPGPADHQPGLAIGLGHVIDEGNHSGSIPARLAIAFADCGQFHGTGLVMNSQSAAQALEQRQRRRYHPIDRLGPLAAPENQQSRIAFGERRTGGDPLPYRIAGDNRASGGKIFRGIGKREADAPRPASHDPVDPPGKGILFVDHIGDPSEPRRDQQGSRGVAADPENQIGTKARQ